MSSEPFVASPGLINIAQSHGLYCASYGSLNDDAESDKVISSTDTYWQHMHINILANDVQIQARGKLDLIVVNKVRKIALVLGNKSA
jgi:hypothetical protein